MGEAKLLPKNDAVSRLFHALKPRSRSSSSDPSSFKDRDGNQRWYSQPESLSCPTNSMIATEFEGTSKSSTTELDQDPFSHPYRSKYGSGMDVFSPLAAPITTIDMNITAERPRIEGDELVIWTAVEVSADAKINKPVTPEKMIPLDVVIVLDNSYVTTQQYWLDLILSFPGQDLQSAF
jgi:hypothetical protein